MLKPCRLEEVTKLVQSHEGQYNGSFEKCERYR
jgi:hypothetical protein